MAEWQVQKDGDVAVVSLDDGKANAHTVPEFKSLEAALDRALEQRALSVVLTGRAGYLSAGLNLKVLASLPVPGRAELVQAMGDAVLKLFLFPRPVVAAVSGHALGGGAMFALASDVRLFAQGPFKFGLNEVAAGMFVPTYAIELARSAAPSHRLTELVGHGRVLSPDEALAWGLAEAVVAPEALLDAAKARAQALAELAGTGYAITKRFLRGPAAELARQRLPAELVALKELTGEG